MTSIRLAKREKWFLGTGGGLLFLLLVYGLVVSPLLQKNRLLDRKIQAKHQELEEMGELNREFKRLNGLVKTAEQRIGKKNTGFSIISYLEGLSGQTNIKDHIDYMRPKPVPAGTLYRETAVEMGLKQVPLPDLVRFLYGIEYSPEFLRLNKVRLRADIKNPSNLDVTLEVSSFELI